MLKWEWSTVTLTEGEKLSSGERVQLSGYFAQLENHKDVNKQ